MAWNTEKLLVQFDFRLSISLSNTALNIQLRKVNQCLWVVKRLLRGCVPVPKVCGWCRDNDEVFIYMDGGALGHPEDWGAENKCEQLRNMLSALRGMKQDSNDRFIGKMTILSVAFVIILTLVRRYWTSTCSGCHICLLTKERPFSYRRVPWMVLEAS